MTFCLNSHLGLFRLLRANDNQMLNFEAATSKFYNCSWKFGSSPRKGKVDLCMTNSSKVLIYLTLLYFLLHYLQEYSKIWNIAKSNKSELWNCLSYRDLPYLFEVRSQTFRNDCQILRSQPQNLEANCHTTSTTLKGLSENQKKMSWHSTVWCLPISDNPHFMGFIHSLRYVCYISELTENMFIGYLYTYDCFMVP